MKSNDLDSCWSGEPEGMCAYEKGEDGTVKITILDQAKYDAYMATLPGFVGTVFVKDDPEQFTLVGMSGSMDCVSGEINALIRALVYQRQQIRKRG